MTMKGTNKCNKIRKRRSSWLNDQGWGEDQGWFGSDTPSPLIYGIHIALMHMPSWEDKMVCENLELN